MLAALVSNLWPKNFEELGQNFSNWFFVVDLSLGIIVCILMTILVFRLLKSKRLAALYLIDFVALITCMCLGLLIFAICVCISLLVITITLLIISSNEIKSLAHDEFNWRGVFATAKNKNNNENVNQLCEEIETAVIDMSRVKCGALIVFERSDRITTDRFSRWNDLDSEVTAPLLETIFYKGSPLHDGATIIREGKILRSGVIFDSVSVSTAAMPGSLGSRHRAALGITESYDCVSVTVSEETGSIHICSNGHIQKCYVSNIKEKLLELIKVEHKKD